MELAQSYSIVVHLLIDISYLYNPFPNYILLITIPYHPTHFNTDYYLRILSNIIKYHPISSNVIKYHPLPYSTIQLYPIPYKNIKSTPIQTMTIQYHPKPWITIHYYTIQSNTIYLHPILLNTKNTTHFKQIPPIIIPQLSRQQPWPYLLLTWFI